MTLMHQFVILESVQRNMHDEDEDHFKRFTRMEHSYMLIFKAYMINMAIKDTKTEKKVDIDFFKDFIIYEHDILHFYDRFSKHDEPVVLHRVNHITRTTSTDRGSSSSRRRSS